MEFSLFNTLKESIRYFDLKYDVSWFLKDVLLYNISSSIENFSLQSCLDSFRYLNSWFLLCEFPCYFYKIPWLIWKPLHRCCKVEHDGLLYFNTYPPSISYPMFFFLCWGCPWLAHHICMHEIIFTPHLWAI